MAVAMDSKGRRTIVGRQSIPVVADADGAYEFEIRIKLPPEHYRIGISMELARTGQTSYVVVRGDLTSESSVKP